jgi:hypothetical protein
MFSDKAKLYIVIIVFMALIVCGLYFIANYAEKKIKERVSKVNSTYKYSKGIITEYQSYKGHSVHVKYEINNNNYEFSGKWDINPGKLREGDSIRFRYYTKDPEFIITELEKEY